MRALFRDVKRVKGRADGFYFRNKNGRLYFDTRSPAGIHWYSSYLHSHKVILPDRSVIKMGVRNNVETWICPKGDDLLYEKAIKHVASISF